jgi:hypothetical protein
MKVLPLFVLRYRLLMQSGSLSHSLQHRFLGVDKADTSKQKPKGAKAAKERVMQEGVRSSRRITQQQQDKAAVAAAAYSGPRRIDLRSCLDELLSMPKQQQQQPGQAPVAMKWDYARPEVAGSNEALKDKVLLWLCTQPQTRVPAPNRLPAEPSHFYSVEELKAKMKVLAKADPHPVVQELLLETNSAALDAICTFVTVCHAFYRDNELIPPPLDYRQMMTLIKVRRCVTRDFFSSCSENGRLTHHIRTGTI